MWPSDAELPTREQPQLAAVLVPTGTEAGGTAAPQEGDVQAAGDGTWIFPFDEPLPPEAGDNQALAVTTTDDTASYAVAFALVWADGDEPATNTNEAYAIASCDNCAAVAVAFQVVLVVGETDVAVPTNVSVAVNYDCTSCLTFSLAVQMFVTLDGPLSEEATASIEELWSEIMEYGATIGQVPLNEIQAQLTEYEDQILAIIEEDQGPLTEDPNASTSPSPTDGGSPTDSASASPSGSGSPSPTGSASSSPSSSTSPSFSSSSSPSQEASPSPSSSSSTPSGSPSSTPSSSPSPTAQPSASP